MTETVREPLLSVKGLKVWFRDKGPLGVGGSWVRAVDGVDLAIEQGRTLALVGESGSGKTTTGRAIVRMEQPRAGEISFGGRDLLALRGQELRKARRGFQMVFQNPYASLDPRMTVGEIVREPLAVHRLRDGSERERVAELLGDVGLDPRIVERYPAQFSGGQRQRLAIARALAAEPRFIVCDEPSSALDVSVQAQITNLLVRLQRELDLTYLFISHDLALVRHIADRVAVMYLGKVIESAPAESLYAKPSHPYTISLLSAVPVPDARVERSRRRIVLKGDLPSAVEPPSGCRFHPRCWLRAELGNPSICSTVAPALKPVGGSPHAVACHYREEGLRAGARVALPIEADERTTGSESAP
jgi:oligopeptide/dipeptide ABC transporter ATP-binding protein